MNRHKRYALSLILLGVVFYAFLKWGVDSSFEFAERFTANPLVLIAALFVSLFIFGALFYTLSGFLLGDSASRRESPARVALHWMLDTFAQFFYVIGSTLLIAGGCLLIFVKAVDACTSKQPWPLSNWGYLALGSVLAALGAYMRSDRFIDGFLDAKEKAHEGADRALGYKKPMAEWVDADGTAESQIAHGDGTALDTWQQKERAAPRHAPFTENSAAAPAQIPQSRPTHIADMRDVLPAMRYLLRENGNEELAVEPDPWSEGDEMFVYAQRLVITKEQAPLIKKYLHNLKPAREQDFFFVQNNSGGKSRVIWQGSEDYQLMQKQKAQDSTWQREQQARKEATDRKVAALKTENKIKPPAGIKIDADSFAEAKRAAASADRAGWLNELLSAHGVEFLSNREQPDGVRWCLLDRDVQMPRAWYLWFKGKDESFSARGFCSIDSLSFDWNLYGVADEETFYRYKIR